MFDVQYCAINYELTEGSYYILNITRLLMSCKRVQMHLLQCSKYACPFPMHELIRISVPTRLHGHNCRSFPPP